MSALLDELKSQVLRLSLEEQRELAAFLAHQELPSESDPPQLSWRDLRGMAPNLLGGEDAQEWVSRTRREAQEHRDQVLGQINRDE